MKSLNLLMILLVSCLSSLAADITVIKNNSSWDDPTTWSLGRVPQNGDRVIVPSGYTLVIDGNEVVDPANLTVVVYGTIHFAVGKLVLGPASTVQLFSGATITTKQGNPSDRITIGGVMKYSGSEGTVSGPLILSLAENAPLPVKFIAYTVSRTSNGVQVQWSTSEEVNADGYVIERSEDGNHWNAIAHLKAAGNSTIVHHYSYTDKQPINKVAYYRVKQVDIDGHFVYTSIKSVRSDVTTSSDVKIAGNTSNIVLEFSKQLKGNVVVRIVSLSGQVMAQQTYNNPTGYVMINRAGFKGNYVVSVSNGQDINIAKQVML